jgi:hypothetical protein
LCRDFTGTTFRIFDFLHTGRWRVRPGLLKQQSLTAAQQLTNFNELRDYFQNTRYASFFEDADSTDSIQPARLNVEAAGHSQTEPPHHSLNILRTIQGLPTMTPTHTNFVLLGHARCGSNLLVRALAENPQVRMTGEVLSQDEATRIAGWERVNKTNWTEPRGEAYRLGEDGAEFLRTRIFSDTYLENICAFGFKLFYDQADFNRHVRSAWDYLVDNTDIKIIHLVRRNLLLSLISKEVAERSNNWYQLSEDKEKRPPLPPFSLKRSVCQRYFDHITEAREQAQQRFAKHDVLTIQYETELCADFRDTTFRAFEFINTVKWRVHPGFIKQQSLTAPQQITNFDELRDSFQNTPYAGFFEIAASTDSIAPARLNERIRA